MVEILVGLKPLVGKVRLIRVKQSLVHWCNVLPSSHAGDKFVAWIHDWRVIKVDTKWEPSLLNLWVEREGKIVVSIDLLKNLKRDLISLG